MDPETSLAQVLRSLQNILSSPDLAVSQYLVPSSEETTNDKFPVLPRDIPSVLLLTRLDQSLPHSSSQPPSGSGRQGGRVDDYGNDNDTPLLDRLSSHLATSVLPHLNLSSLSPNYYGFVTGGATPAALLGDLLASVYDQNVQVHLPRETIATTLEVTTLNLLVQLFRLPEAEWGIGRRGGGGGGGGGGGTFTTGATASNVLGLALGREFVLRKALQRRTGISAEEDDGDAGSCGEHGVAELMAQAGLRKIQVLSTLPHSSIAKAASIVGIGRKNVISISTSTSQGDGLQIDLARLAEEAAKPDVVNILAISAGEVNTGRFATDSRAQMLRLRRMCDEFGIWIHVDGAFGLFGRVFSPDDHDRAEFEEMIRGVDGLELADSITGDCHKLLNVPYDCGVFFTRHKGLSEDVFRNGNAAYLTSSMTSNTDADTNAVASGDVSDYDPSAIQSPLNIGIENSRRFRALPVYATLVAYGRPGYLDMLKRQIRLARRVSSWLLRDERFDLLPLPARAGGREDGEQETLAKTFIVVLFRLKDEERMRDFVRRVNDTGKIYMTGTVWDGKPAARIAISNWKVDLARDGKLIEQVLDQVAGGQR
ncbi:putative tyrosine decarboxylase [Fonsecaea pedrosoi]|nr:putative tyrosine decarboxylase [Fonsecaea pedrosoi]